MDIAFLNLEDAAQADAYLTLAREVFGLDLSAWLAGGFWRGGPRILGLAQNGRLAASLTIADMTLRLRGTPRPAAQIGTVQVAPALRGRGLGTELLARALGLCPPDVFLFARAELAPLYGRLGFRGAVQRVMRVPLPPPAGEPERLTPRELYSRLDPARCAESAILDVRRERSFYGANLSLGRRRDLYWLPAGCAAVAHEEGGVLHVHDLLAAQPAPWETVGAQLAALGGSEAVFHFTPDRWLSEYAVIDLWRGERLFTRGDFLRGLPEFCYPVLCRA